MMYARITSSGETTVHLVYDFDPRLIEISENGDCLGISGPIVNDENLDRLKGLSENAL